MPAIHPNRLFQDLWLVFADPLERYNYTGAMFRARMTHRHGQLTVALSFAIADLVS